MAVSRERRVGPAPPARGPRAVVLPVALLLLLAATVLVHGSMVVASALLRGSDAAWRAVQVRRAAGGVATMAALGGSSPAGGVVADAVDVGVRAHALSPEVTIFVGRASTLDATWTAGRLRWTPDPLVRASDGAAIRWGGRLVQVGASTRLEAGPTPTCGLAGIRVLQAPLGAGGIGIGPLGPGELYALLPPGDPGATCTGACLPSAITAGGPLRLSSGVFSGLLFVRGDLELAGDAQVRGVVLVQGDLRVRGSAAVEGEVQVDGDIVLRDSGALVGDACLVASMWRDAVAEQVGPVLLDAAPWAVWGGFP